MKINNVAEFQEPVDKRPTNIPARKIVTAVILFTIIVIGLLSLKFAWVTREKSSNIGVQTASTPQSDIIASDSFQLFEDKLSPEIKLPDRLMVGDYKLTWVIDCRQLVPLVIVPNGDISQSTESDKWQDMIGSYQKLQFCIRSNSGIRDKVILRYAIRKK